MSECLSSSERVALATASKALPCSPASVSRGFAGIGEQLHTLSVPSALAPANRDRNRRAGPALLVSSAGTWVLPSSPENCPASRRICLPLQQQPLALKVRPRASSFAPLHHLQLHQRATFEGGNADSRSVCSWMDDTFNQYLNIKDVGHDDFLLRDRHEWPPVGDGTNSLAGSAGKDRVIIPPSQHSQKQIIIFSFAKLIMFSLHFSITVTKHLLTCEKR